jgi:hypothetical protein
MLPVHTNPAYLELWKAFLISIDSSMMASYSDWSEVNKAGIEVWFAGLGGRVDGSVLVRYCLFAF